MRPVHIRAETAAKPVRIGMRNRLLFIFGDLPGIPSRESLNSFGNKIAVLPVLEDVGLIYERQPVLDLNEVTAFNEAVLPHLDTAYNLARWLTRNDQDAQDVVQEASLRAFKYWKGFSGRDCRSWLLAIVRNTFYSWVRQRSVQP